MQFSLLYRYDPAGPGPVVSDIDVWVAVSDDLKKAGALVHAAGFFSADEAVSVTRSADGTITTSPGAQPGDPVAGYVTIQVASLDEAIEAAAKLPVAGKGTVEIRQLVEFEA